MWAGCTSAGYDRERVQALIELHDLVIKAPEDPPKVSGCATQGLASTLAWLARIESSELGQYSCLSSYTNRQAA